MESRALGLLPYRPDLLRRIGPAASHHSALRNVLLTSPACAVALLTGFYDETAPWVEASLAGSGESIFHLLQWASRHGRALRQPESFYRQSLITDSYWGLRQAHRTRDIGLFADVTAWCGDQRRDHAAAAAFFLVRRPREPVAPYREVLLSNPFYAYLCLPRLAPRGFSVTPEDIGNHPKWACHFALSKAVARPDRFMAMAASDPGWAVELAAARGWLAVPERRKELGQIIAAGDEDHPLRIPALRYLHEAAQPHPTPASLWTSAAVSVPRTIPTTLTSGQIAETRALGALQISKNTVVWRPSLRQVDTPAFRQIVGLPRFTGLGRSSRHCRRQRRGRLCRDQIRVERPQLDVSAPAANLPRGDGGAFFQNLHESADRYPVWPMAPPLGGQDRTHAGAPPLKPIFHP